jgi:3-dehydroquinate dehydratase
VSAVSDVVICGAGVFGYDLALQAMASKLAELA